MLHPNEHTGGVDMKQGIYMREIVAESKEAVIDIIGEIGWEVWYPEMRRILASIPETIETVIFAIFSPGGDVWEGNAIITEIGALSQKTIARVQLAASMATLIAVACDEREIASNGRWLVHNPWTFLRGDADALETASKELRDCEKEGAEFYASRTGMKVEAVQKLMNEERWLTASETKDLGFVGKINDPFDAKAFAGVTAEIVAAGKWPKALVDIPEGGTDNADEKTTGAKGRKTAPDGTPVKPEDAKEYTKGYQAGSTDADAKAAVRVAAEFAAKIEQMDKAVAEAEAEADKKDGLLSKMQGERDSGLARIAALQDSLKEAKEKMDKLTAGGMTFSPDIETWEDAMQACEGDYVKARKEHPKLFQMERARAKESRKKGSGIMHKVGIFLAALLIGGLAYGQTVTELTNVTSFATPTLVDEINTAIGAANDNFDLVDEGSDVTYGDVSVTGTLYGVSTDGATTNAVMTNGVIDSSMLGAASVASAIDVNAVTNFDMANLAAGTTAAAFDGSAITALDAASLSAASVASAIDGNAVTNLDAANILAASVVSAIDGNAITNFDMANLAAGTTAAAFDGSAITALDAANISAATVISAIDGNAITNLDLANLAAGTTAAAFDGAAITALDAANLTAGTIASAIDGTAVTNLDAANIAAATVATAIDINAATNFNMANLAAGTTAAAFDGSAITSLASANLAGNIAIARMTNALANPGAIGSGTAGAGYFDGLQLTASTAAGGETNTMTNSPDVNGNAAPKWFTITDSTGNIYVVPGWEIND